MYALYLNAVPDELNQDYDHNQSYPIIVVVNTLSERYAGEKAEKVLRENHWKDINFQKIGKMPKEDRDTRDAVIDYRIYVFPDAKRNRVQELMEKVKALISRLTQLKG